MLSMTIIHGDIGTGKTLVANAMAKAYANTSVHEVSSMAEVRAAFVLVKDMKRHFIFVCNRGFYLGANAVAESLSMPPKHVTAYNIYMTKNG